MASFNRGNRKEGRRMTQQRAVDKKANEEDDYFWTCVRNEERNKELGRFTKPSETTEASLFHRQGASGIKFEQYSAIPVTRSGPPSDDVPELESFSKLASILPKFLGSNLTQKNRMNYAVPTPIQRHTIPLSLSGKFDVMACAQTGSGKTVAFLVPLVSHIASTVGIPSQNGRGASGRGGGGRGAGGRGAGGRGAGAAGTTEVAAPGVTPAAPSAVVVAPTRELAVQIELEAHKLTFDSPLCCTCVYGGVPARGQLALLAKGVDILIATPGRLNDFLSRKLISLRNVKFFVMDEADRMLDMGFEPQIRKICESYDLPAVHARRTLMFSATFPDGVQRIAQKYMRSYVFVAVGRVGSTISSITQRLINCPYSDKRRKLEIVMDLINPRDKTLIFCLKKHTASWVAREIQRELRNVRTESIHGDRSQSQREDALEKFRDGRADVLVATEVAARGLDVLGITHVIQFDMPTSADDFDSYVHKIGRTGRAGRTGVATSLFVPGMDAKSGQNGALYAPLLKLLEEGKQEIPDWFIQLDPRAGYRPGLGGAGAGAGAGKQRGVGGGSRGAGGTGGAREEQPQQDVRVGGSSRFVSTTTTYNASSKASAAPIASSPAHEEPRRDTAGRGGRAVHGTKDEREGRDVPPAPVVEKPRRDNDRGGRGGRGDRNTPPVPVPPPPPTPVAASTVVAETKRGRGKRGGGGGGGGGDKDRAVATAVAAQAPTAVETLPPVPEGKAKRSRGGKKVKESGSAPPVAAVAAAPPATATTTTTTTTTESKRGKKGGRGKKSESAATPAAAQVQPTPVLDAAAPVAEETRGGRGRRGGKDPVAAAAAMNVALKAATASAVDNAAPTKSGRGRQVIVTPVTGGGEPTNGASNLLKAAIGTKGSAAKKVQPPAAAIPAAPVVEKTEGSTRRRGKGNASNQRPAEGSARSEAAAKPVNTGRNPKTTQQQSTAPPAPATSHSNSATTSGSSSSSKVTTLPRAAKVISISKK